LCIHAVAFEFLCWVVCFKIQKKNSKLLWKWFRKIRKIKQKGFPLSSRLLAQPSGRPAPSLTPRRPASPLQAQVAPQASWGRSPNHRAPSSLCHSVARTPLSLSLSGGSRVSVTRRRRLPPQADEILPFQNPQRQITSQSSPSFSSHASGYLRHVPELLRSILSPSPPPIPFRAPKTLERCCRVRFDEFVVVPSPYAWFRASHHNFEPAEALSFSWFIPLTVRRRRVQELHRPFWSRTSSPSTPCLHFLPWWVRIELLVRLISVACQMVAGNVPLGCAGEILRRRPWGPPCCSSFLTGRPSPPSI
jgi:hypothetical protein